MAAIRLDDKELPTHSEALCLCSRRFLSQRYQRASASNDSPRTLKRLATDGVEDQVDVLEVFLEGFAIVFENGISTQALNEISITRRAGGNSFRAEVLRQLNRKTADPTSRAVDQDTLARAEKRLGTKCLPRGKRRQGNRSRAKMVHAPRLGRQFGDPGDRELRRRTIAKEVYQPVNLVSGRDSQGVGSHFRYYSGDFMRRDDGETALALFVGPGGVPRKLGRRNCSRVHLDQHLATIRHGAGNAFIDQSFRPTSLVAADRIHCWRCFH